MIKISTSPSKLYSATEKSNKLLKSLVNTRYKPKTFAEGRTMVDEFIRKYKQNKFFNTEINKLLIPKVKELLKIKYE